MEVKCRYDALIPVGDLVPHPDNANEHSEDQIKRLAKLLKYQGVRAPIIVSNQTKFIVKGHGTLMAIVKNGWHEAPVVYQDFDDFDQEYAFVQSDNAISEWARLNLRKINLKLPEIGPMDLDLLGFKDFKVESADRSHGAEDKVPELAKPISKLGDLYILGDHRLLCGDATSTKDIERLMDGEKPDMVFTDPPYGVSVVKSSMVGANFGIAKKGKYKEVIGDQTTECARKFYEACKTLRFQNFIIWGGNYFTDFLEPSKSWVIWNKRGSTNITNSFADAELAWSNIGFPARVHSQLWNGMIREGEHEKRVHPTQKPINLAEFCFDLMKKNKSVFDGFGGSGSTLIACHKTQRKCFMMELDPAYIDVILTRWAIYSGKDPVREDGKTWSQIKKKTPKTVVRKK